MSKFYVDIYIYNDFCFTDRYLKIRKIFKLIFLKTYFFELLLFYIISIINYILFIEIVYNVFKAEKIITTVQLILFKIHGYITTN